MRRTQRKIILIVTVILYYLINATYAANSAVFIIYHRFGESKYPSTNITISQFKNQLNYLKQQHFNVLPVPKIISDLQHQQPLPNKTIGIMIDDAYDSAYYVAWPLLKKYGFPFTLFVATDPVDKGYNNMLTWKQIHEMEKAGVTIGNHSSTHGHLALKSYQQIYQDIEHAQRRIQQQLGITPTLFAYPYGEYSLTFKKVIKSLGFKAAFMQVSGSASDQSDFFALPRFALNESYGSLARFKLIVNTLPINIKDLQPKETIVSQNPPHVFFTVTDNNINLHKLKCFASDQGATKIYFLGRKRIEIIPKSPFVRGRARINCTVPEGKHQFRWLGLFFLVR